jgi:hypothetical protein
LYYSGYTGFSSTFPSISARIFSNSHDCFFGLKKKIYHEEQQLRVLHPNHNAKERERAEPGQLFVRLLQIFKLTEQGVTFYHF